MSLADYWAAVDLATARARRARSAAEVTAALSEQIGLPELSGHGFYGGDGDELLGALHDAGWAPVEIRASYHWCMRAPDGSTLTYVEGDVYEGNSMP